MISVPVVFAEIKPRAVRSGKRIVDSVFGVGLPPHRPATIGRVYVHHSVEVGCKQYAPFHGAQGAYLAATGGNHLLPLRIPCQDTPDRDLPYPDPFGKDHRGIEFIPAESRLLHLPRRRSGARRHQAAVFGGEEHHHGARPHGIFGGGDQTAVGRCRRNWPSNCRCSWPAESAGAKGLIVHARYTSQMHGGPTHLDLLKEVVARAKIPVTGNGSVTDGKSAAAMASMGVSSIMIGRAALSNPGIFNSLKSIPAYADACRHCGGETPPPRKDAVSRGGAVPAAQFWRHLDYLLQFRDQLAARFPHDHIPSPDAFASVKMHVHLFRYFNGRPGAAELRKRLNTVRTLAEIETIVRKVAN